MAKGKVRNRQFRKPVVIALQIDGSDVSTTNGEGGLDVGGRIAKIKKGAAGDANLVTITLNKPLGVVPQVVIQEVTVDCQARLEAAPTVDTIQIRTLELDGVTAENDADLNVFIFATEHGESAEGWTY